MTPSLTEPLVARVREFLGDRPSTEAELRALGEEADAWARTLEGRVHGSERRLGELTADPATSLSEIAAELRRLDPLRRERDEMRTLLVELDERARQLRTAWLLGQARADRPLPVR